MNPPHLSKGFFQKFLENNLPSGFKPVLQIVDARQMRDARRCFRLRLSDGQFAYSWCRTTDNIANDFEDDELPESTGIIRVTDFTRVVDDRIRFLINNYVLITKAFPVQDRLTHHSGRASDFSGIENFRLEKCGAECSQLKRPGSRNTFSQPLVKRSADDFQNLTPVRMITPFLKKWRICGIVSVREHIHDINSAKGYFRIFAFTITDQDGDSIRMSTFGVEATHLNSIIIKGRIYYISGGTSCSIRPANKMFNATAHQYEVTLGRNSLVSFCKDIEIEMPKFQITPVPLDRIAGCTDELVDVLAVVDRVGELLQVTTRKESRLLDKRDIFLMDKSGMEVVLTLWDYTATDFDISNVGQVVGLKAVSVREFNGGVSLTPSTSYFEMKYNPEGEATEALHEWYAKTRSTMAIKSLSVSTDPSGLLETDWRLIGVVVGQQMGQETDCGIYLNVKAMIISVRTENAFYQGCPTKGCRKKLTVENTNQYRCDKCNATYDVFQNIVMLSVELADISGTVWATIFDDKATSLLGVTGDQMAELYHNDVREDLF